jgi:hypothetical protein
MATLRFLDHARVRLPDGTVRYERRTPRTAARAAGLIYIVLSMSATFFVLVFGLWLVTSLWTMYG